MIEKLETVQKKYTDLEIVDDLQQVPYRKSIVSTYNRCFLCGSSKHIEIHHIFNGPLRKKSTKYGLVVPLCDKCHRGPNGVHNNREKMLFIKKTGQQIFQKYYPKLDFISIFHKNYLD